MKVIIIAAIAANGVVGPEDAALVERIMGRCVFADPLVDAVSGDCWQWTGPTLPRGYGTMAIHRKTTYVHREMARIALGGSDGRHIDHLCRRKGCCNPLHLEYVTVRENNIRTPRCESIRTGKCRRCGSGDGKVTAPSRGRVKWKCRPCHAQKQRADRARNAA